MKRERFLQKHDIPISKVEQSFTVPKSPSTSGPSTTYLDEEDLRIYFSMSEYATDAWDVFLQWNWRNQDADDWGEDPKDQVGIAYEEDHYYFNSDEEWHSNDYTDIATFSTTGDTGGISWEFRDRYGDGGNNYYGEIIARYNQDNITEERQIEADYTHTWDGVIDYVELGFPQIITVSWDQEGGSYECRDQYDGDPLVISPSNTTA